MKIRPEQIEVFEQAALKRFEDEMLKHIQEYFPNHWRITGETQLRQVIQYGVKQAEQYGLTTQREVCLYLNLMLLLGSDFDTDIQLPWAEEVLKNETIKEPFERINQLYEMAIDYLDNVAGVNNEHLEQALLKIRDKSPDSVLSSLIPLSETYLLSLLKGIYPHKCEATGEDNLRRLIRQGMESAGHYHVASQKGTILYIGLMFMLGSRFKKDPQFPWATAILDDNSITDPKIKAKRLYEEAKIQLAKWLA